MNELARDAAAKLLNPTPDIAARIERGIEDNRKGWGVIRIVDSTGKPVIRATVRLKLVKHAFHFGGNAFLLNQFEEADRNAAHDEAFKRIFNLAVVPFYWSDLEPEQGKPRFAKDSPKIYRRPAPDLVLEFCETNGIEPKGHPLCWHSTLPDWLPTDKRQVAALLERRIEEIAARYRERIRIWDVCNEPLGYPAYNPPALRLPDNHAEFSFQVASRCFPRSSMLTLNDFICWETLRGEYTPYYMLARHLQQLDVNLGGLGLQFHMFCRGEKLREWSQSRLDPHHLLATLDQYARLGIPMNISEVTIGSHEDLGDGQAFQREVTERLYRLWFSHPMTNGIVYWNLVDGATYVKPGWDENQYKGGLLNNDLSPKPVFEALERLIRGEWHTSETVEYEEGANNRFHGFYGDYEASVQTGSGETTHSLRLSNESSNNFIFTI